MAAFHTLSIPSKPLLTGVEFASGPGCPIQSAAERISRIEREFEASDQRRFFVACPHCGWRNKPAGGSGDSAWTVVASRPAHCFLVMSSGGLRLIACKFTADAHNSLKVCLIMCSAGRLVVIVVGSASAARLWYNESHCSAYQKSIR